MGLMDSLKKATGLGLDAAGHYDRAYTKAILLGPENYTKAAEFFDTAATKAGEEGKPELGQRATANHHLYGFVVTGSDSRLQPLYDALNGLQDIERIGSQTEMMSAESLRSEIGARIAELSAVGGKKPSADQATAHDAAALAFKPLFSTDLVTYEYHAFDQHTSSGQQRFFYHSALASYHRAIVAMSSEPEQAAQQMAKALTSFRNCTDEEWARRCDRWLGDCRQRRTCWMCHREFQGANVHFRAYPSDLSPYVLTVVERLQQDASAVDLAKEEIVLCGPCGSAVEKQADAYAMRRTRELREAFETRLANYESIIGALANRIDRLESLSHRH